MKNYPGAVLQDIQNTSFTSFLDLSRWTAAMIVFLSHLRDPLFLGYGSLTGAERNAGVQTWFLIMGWRFQAVIVFFVLSGYLVGGIACARASIGSFSIRSYAIDRISRLYIPLFPGLLLTAILDTIGSRLFADTGFWTHTHPMLIEKLTTGPFLDYLTTQNFFANFFMLQTIVAPPFGSDTPLWTISLEFWFYVVFGIALMILRLPVRRRILAALLALGVLLIFLGREFPVYMGLWLIGVLAAFVPQRAVERPLWAAIIFAGALVFERIKLIGVSEAGWKYWLPQYLVAATFTWLLVSLRSVRLPVLELASGFNKFMADFSYSLYLIHFPLMLFLLGALHATGQFGAIASGYSPMSKQGLFLYGVVIAVTYATAWLFSLATERQTPRGRRLLNRLFVKRNVGMGQSI